MLASSWKKIKKIVALVINATNIWKKRIDLASWLTRIGHYLSFGKNSNSNMEVGSRTSIYLGYLFFEVKQIGK